MAKHFYFAYDSAVAFTNNNRPMQSITVFLWNSFCWTTKSLPFSDNVRSLLSTFTRLLFVPTSKQNFCVQSFKAKFDSY